MPMPGDHLLLTRDRIRAREADGHAACGAHTLMRRAADAAARLIAERWPRHAVAILCGPGNNGGDGLMLAARLHAQGRDVRVWALPRADRPPPDTAQAWRELPTGLAQDGPPDLVTLPAGLPVLLVDALFGLGPVRPPAGEAARWLDWLSRQHADILALDLPSGLDADTGHALPGTPRASATLTFIADKPGLHTCQGPDLAGDIVVDPLGLAPSPHPADGHLVVRAACGALFRPRPRDSHKGSFGTVVLIGGGAGMAGAALLAGRAALRGGAGKVFVGVADPAAPPCDPLQPELMLRPAAQLLAPATLPVASAWVAGCGLDTGDTARELLRACLATPGDTPLLLDADALNLLAADERLRAALHARPGLRVLTPHPLEAARLLACDTATVQADRIAAARALARRFRAWIVLKGAGTLVCDPDGNWSINGSGNPGLATAGTGDVLAGLLGALLAQGLAPGDAIRGGVWLHGAAADRLAAQGIGPIGLTASDIIDAARAVRNGG